MRKATPWVGLAAGLIMGMTGGLFAAESQPAAKVTARVADIAIVNSDVDVPYTPVLNATLRTSALKDLFVDVSLECGLFTRTQVVSEGGTLDTSSARSSVKVRVLMDAGTVNERELLPGEITFCRRAQTLSAQYGGVENCNDENGDGIVQYSECETTPEMTEFILDTMNANAFNFVIDDVGAGVHTITVEARIDLEEEFMEGEAEAMATIGRGAVTVEEVRLAPGTDLEL